jgi:hypothetical protein
MKTGLPGDWIMAGGRNAWSTGAKNAPKRATQINLYAELIA